MAVAEAEPAVVVAAAAKRLDAEGEADARGVTRETGRHERHVIDVRMCPRGSSQSG